MQLRRFLPVAILFFAFAASAMYASAWTGPSVAPPGGNVSAPLNVGSSAQFKAGNLGVGQTTLPVLPFEVEGPSMMNGSLVLYGANRFLNFGTSGGANGYGIRDNAGTMEYKNSAGTWTSLAAAASNNVWATNGTTIYNTNTGNVGIGIASPNAGYKLHVYKDGWKALVQGTDGYIAFGPANASWAHIYTDRPNFVFNHNLYVLNGDGTGTGPGGISSYNTQDLALMTGGTTRLTVLNANGNVGIGTAGPAFKLDVAGAVNATQYCIAGANCISAWPGGGGAVSGTANRVAKFTNATTIGDSLIIDNGTNVGISNTAPAYKFDVTGDIRSTTVVRANGGSGSALMSAGTGSNAGYIAWYKPNGSTRMGYMGWDPTNINLNLESGASFVVTNGYTVLGSRLSVGENLYVGNYLETTGAARVNGFFVVASNNGGIAIDALAGNVRAPAFVYSSDSRLKKDIAPLTGNLEKVLQLEPVSYLWENPTKQPFGSQIGFVAQDVEVVEPRIVSEDGEGMKAIDYARMTPLLVGSVHELSAKIDAQQKEIDELRAQIHELIAD